MPAARNFAIRVLRALLTLLAIFVSGGAVYALPPASALEQQVEAVIGRDLGVDPAILQEKVRVLAPFDSLPTETVLRVVSMKREFAPGTWVVRLDCRWRRDCLPFDALLHSPEANLVTPGASSGARPSSRAAPLAHSGDHVELLAELSGVRLRATAVCLESGALGDRIRVRNLSTHRVLVATVAGEKLLRVEP